MQVDAPPTLVYGCESSRHAADVITRTALAYSNLRRIRWWLAYLELPLLWLLTSLPIVRRPQLVASLGAASTLLESLPTSAGPERRLRRPMLLVLCAAALFGVIVFGPLPIVAALGRSNAAGAAVLAWYGTLILLPVLSFAVPALVQHWLGRGRRRWITTTVSETNRRPVLVTELAAWPATGGGRRGTGDGFTLITALASEFGQDDAILVGTARTKTLATRYRTRTGAIASPRNARLLRWP